MINLRAALLAWEYTSVIINHFDTSNPEAIPWFWGPASEANFYGLEGETGLPVPRIMEYARGLSHGCCGSSLWLNTGKNCGLLGNLDTEIAQSNSKRYMSTFG